MNPPPEGTMTANGYVYFDCDDFEIDAKPAPFILITMDRGRPPHHQEGPSSTGRDNLNSARSVVANRVRNGRATEGWVYQQDGDVWRLVHSERDQRDRRPVRDRIRQVNKRPVWE